MNQVNLITSASACLITYVDYRLEAFQEFGESFGRAVLLMQGRNGPLAKILVNEMLGVAICLFIQHTLI